jgi:hypothetical protein
VAFGEQEEERGRGTAGIESRGTKQAATKSQRYDWGYAAEAGFSVSFNDRILDLGACWA